MPPNTFSPPGGNFAASPNNVQWISQSDGIVDLTTTPPGSYLISYIPDVDSCASTSTDTLRIIARDSAIFDYQATYCQRDTTKYPAISNLPPGFFEATPRTPSNILEVDSTNGGLNLATADPGVYDIVYTPSGGCSVQSLDSVTIQATPNVNWSFTDPSVCQDAGSVLPLGVTTGAGYSFRDTSGNVSIDQLTGVVNLATSTPGGPYYIFYVVDTGSCADSATAPLTIGVRDTFAVGYPQNSYCKSGSNPTPIFTSGGFGGTFYSDPNLNSVNLNPSTGEINMASVSNGTYDIFYISPDSLCEDTVSVATQLRIEQKPDAVFTLPNNTNIDTLCAASGSYPLGNIVNVGDSAWYVVSTPGGQLTNAVTNDSINTDVIPSGGPYPIRRYVRRGACMDTATCYIRIEPLDSAGFYYVEDTLCADATNPTPLITGVGGGTFSSPTAVLVDPISGRVDLGPTTELVLHTIYYTTPGPCPNTDSTTIYVLPASSAKFNYLSFEDSLEQTGFCSYDSVALCDVLVNGGTFSVLPNTGLSMNTNNGNIFPSASTPGEYKVTYQLTNAACDQTFTLAIEIIAADDSTTMGYDSLVYCPNDPDPSPTLIGDSTGVFLGLPGLNFTDTLGTISLSSSNADTFVIRYQLPNECGRTLEDTVVIEPFAASVLQYPSSSFCTTDDNPTPVSQVFPGSSFYATDLNNNIVPFVDPSTGEFYVDSVTQSNSSYAIYYDPNTGCSEETSTVLTVNLGPTGVEIIADPSDTLCEGELVTFTPAGNGDSYSFYLNGILQTTNLRFSTDQLADGDQISLHMENAAQCRDSVDTTVVVYPKPNLTIVDATSSISGNQPIQIDVVSDQDNSTFGWISSSGGNANFDVSTDTVGPGNAGVVVPISNQAFLIDSLSPAVLTYVITPVANGCPGDPGTVEINVNPNDLPIFIPEVMTPNGDGLNDTWLIQWRSDVNPNDYTMLLYNRSGGLVHTMRPLDSVWDAERLPDGVYWWSLLDATGNSILKGGLTIRRK